VGTIPRLPNNYTNLKEEKGFSFLISSKVIVIMDKVD